VIAADFSYKLCSHKLTLTVGEVKMPLGCQHRRDMLDGLMTVIQ
jgi:hypothetical protein